LQGLNSSLAQSDGKLLPAGKCPPEWLLREQNFDEFLVCEFRSRYARKSVKDSIDADFDLVFNKTLSQKNESMGWGPRLAKGGENFQNMPSL